MGTAYYFGNHSADNGLESFACIVIRCSFFVQVGALKSQSTFHIGQNKSRAFAVLLFIFCAAFLKPGFR